MPLSYTSFLFFFLSLTPYHKILTFIFFFSFLPCSHLLYLHLNLSVLIAGFLSSSPSPPPRLFLNHLYFTSSSPSWYFACLRSLVSSPLFSSCLFHNLVIQFVFVLIFLTLHVNVTNLGSDRLLPSLSLLNPQCTCSIFTFSLSFISSSLVLSPLLHSPAFMFNSPSSSSSSPSCQRCYSENVLSHLLLRFLSTLLLPRGFPLCSPVSLLSPASPASSSRHYQRRCSLSTPLTRCLVPVSAKGPRGYRIIS